MLHTYMVVITMAWPPPKRLLCSPLYYFTTKKNIYDHIAISCVLFLWFCNQGKKWGG
jgi:hypothetical protein